MPNEKKRGPGRPRKGSSRIGYQRLAVYPKTHARIKRNAIKARLPIVEYLEQEIK